MLGPLPVEPVPFDVDQATLAGLLIAETSKAGLSLGDRACLALALTRKARVLTADRAWLTLAASLDLDIVSHSLTTGRRMLPPLARPLRKP